MKPGYCSRVFLWSKFDLLKGFICSFYFVKILNAMWKFSTVLI